MISFPFRLKGVELEEEGDGKDERGRVAWGTRGKKVS